MPGWCGAAHPPRGPQNRESRAPPARRAPRKNKAARRLRDAPPPRGRVSAKKSAAERRAANPPRAERAHPPQNKAARLTNRRGHGIIPNTIITRDELRPPLLAGRREQGKAVQIRRNAHYRVPPWGGEPGSLPPRSDRFAFFGRGKSAGSGARPQSVLFP